MPDGFFGSVRRETGERCGCSCHPRRPETDLHGYGADCYCRHTDEERRAYRLALQAEHVSFWASPEGRDIETARQVEEDAPAGRLSAQPGVVITSHGTTPADGCGETPLGRARFLVDTIRTHLRRRECTAHTAGRAALEQLLGSPPAFCPACGQRVEKA